MTKRPKVLPCADCGVVPPSARKQDGLLAYFGYYRTIRCVCGNNISSANDVVASWNAKQRAIASKKGEAK